MSWTTSSPLLAPRTTLRIDSETGGAFGFVAEAAWKPDERNVVISSLQLASAQWASWIRNLTTTSFNCFCSWTAFLPPSTAAALAATKASVAAFNVDGSTGCGGAPANLELLYTVLPILTAAVTTASAVILR